jgi:hypothetical protein
MAGIDPTDQLVLEEWQSSAHKLADNLGALRSASHNKALTEAQVRFELLQISIVMSAFSLYVSAI